MAAAAHGRQNGAYIHIVNPAARHHINFIFHARNGENGVQVFHFHHFLHEKSKIGHVLFHRHARDDDLQTVYMVAGNRLNHIV